MKRREFFKALLIAPVAVPIALKASPPVPLERPSPTYSTILDPDGVTRVYHYWGDKVICTEEILQGKRTRMFLVEDLDVAVKRWNS
jgi:hypothetical protein